VTTRGGIIRPEPRLAVKFTGTQECADNDIDDFLKNPPGPGESPQARLMEALIDFDKPLVAAVHGAAIEARHRRDRALPIFDRDLETDSSPAQWTAFRQCVKAADAVSGTASLLRSSAARRARSGPSVPTIVRGSRSCF
jgi:hypothetical protein